MKNVLYTAFICLTYNFSLLIGQPNDFVSINSITDLASFASKVVAFSVTNQSNFPSTQDEFHLNSTRFGFVEYTEKTHTEELFSLHPLLKTQNGYFFSINNASLKGQNLKMRNISRAEAKLIQKALKKHNVSFEYGRHDVDNCTPPTSPKPQSSPEVTKPEDTLVIT